MTRRRHSTNWPSRPITELLIAADPDAWSHPVVYILPRVSGEFGECQFRTVRVGVSGVFAQISESTHRHNVRH
ncbi:hypothetical protein JOB18_044724 [Solea senegalensis]|uniref:Uncharacterized protein n=1 Tax=Solea senegalensis TaxID=28829 RepID=A0AAV6SIR7_SOLSE|nr:hypothetical protein JOB18_044724 [Solea senegalensis]